MKKKAFAEIRVEKWFSEHGYKFMVKKSGLLKTVYLVSKNGHAEQFDLPKSTERPTELVELFALRFKLNSGIAQFGRAMIKKEQASTPKVTRITKRDISLINSLVDRATVLDIGRCNYETQCMDLVMAHRQFHLALEDLLLAEDEDFKHDFCGIQRHINRKTCRVEGFVPKHIVH